MSHVHHFFSHVLVPMQENGYNCGIFVCHYAVAMYYLHDVEVSYADLSSEQPPLMIKLSDSHYLGFNQSETDKFVQSYYFW